MAKDAPYIPQGMHDNQQEQVRVEAAIEAVCEQFPFQGYVDPTSGAHLNIANTVLTYLAPGSRILDFGSGPCDKTAVLQFLGFVCSACDDLQDYWHKTEGSREKIVAFAEKCGIEFHLVGSTGLPYDREYFDMLMLHDVLEHLHNSPRSLLIELLELVRPEGLLFATVPNLVNIRKRVRVLIGATNLPSFDDYYWYPDPWRGHVREYVKDDLAKLSEYLDLDVVELRSCHHMLHRVGRAVRPLYLAVTSIFTGWADSWLLVARKRPGWAPRRTAAQNELAKYDRGRLGAAW